MADEKVLIDSGATANFLNQRVAKRLGFKPKKLERPVPVKNVDGTLNKDGQCKAPWGLRLGCEFVHLTDCETTG